jgi:hypothetical protein
VLKHARRKKAHAQNKKWARTHWTSPPRSEQETDYKGKRAKGQKRSDPKERGKVKGGRGRVKTFKTRFPAHFNLFFLYPFSRPPDPQFLP